MKSTYKMKNFLYNAYAYFFYEYYRYFDMIVFRKDWDGIFTTNLVDLVKTTNTLYLDHEFNKNIFTKDNQEKFNTINRIEFSFMYNHSVEFLPKNTKTIIFGPNFNQPVDNLPDTVETIKFGYEFNHPVDNLPKTITDLVFKNEFNQPVDFFPDNLKKLRLGYKFNHSLDNLPPNLETLVIEGVFNKKLDNLPKSLKHLEIKGEFYHPLTNLPNLEVLKLGFYIRYRHSLLDLPDSIKILQVPKDYPYTLTKLPKNIEEVYFYTETFDTNINPIDTDEEYKQLRKIEISSDCTFKSQLYEKYGSIISTKLSYKHQQWAKEAEEHEESIRRSEDSYWNNDVGI